MTGTEHPPQDRRREILRSMGVPGPAPTLRLRMLVGGIPIDVDPALPRNVVQLRSPDGTVDATINLNED